MSDTRQAVSMATLATLSVRQHNYTDERCRELVARLDALQAERRREATEAETRKSRQRFLDRTSFVLLAAILAVFLDRTTGLPHLAVIALGATPELAREVFELVRKLG